MVGERTRIVSRKKGTLARLGIRNFQPTRHKAERLAMLHTPEGSPLPSNVSAESQRTGDRVRGKGWSPWPSLLPGGSEAALAGGPEHYRHRCDGRRYLAGWLQFARPPVGVLAGREL